MKNIGEAFTFPFRDPNWPAKMLMGGFVLFLSLFMIGIPVLYGYLIELVRRVRNGERHPLPEWRDLGVMFITGVKYLLVLFVYSFPIVIIVVPLLITLALLVLGSGDGNPEAFFPGAAGLMLLLIVLGAYSLLITLIRPLITVRFADRERIGDALNVGQILRDFRNRWQECLVITVITIAAGVLSVAGILIFLVGFFVTVFYAHLIEFHLCGQLAASADQHSIAQRP